MAIVFDSPLANELSPLISAIFKYMLEYLRSQEGGHES